MGNLRDFCIVKLLPQLCALRTRRQVSIGVKSVWVRLFCCWVGLILPHSSKKGKQWKGFKLHQTLYCGAITDTPGSRATIWNVQRKLNRDVSLPALYRRSPGRGLMEFPSPAKSKWSTPTPCWRSPASSRTTPEDTNVWRRTRWARTRRPVDWRSTVPRLFV